MTAFDDEEDKMVKRLMLKADKKAKRKKCDMPLDTAVLGVFGWHIALPVILSIPLGVWLDKFLELEKSSVIFFILGGFAVGIFNSYRWVKEKGVLEKRKCEAEEIEEMIQEEEKEKAGENK